MAETIEGASVETKQITKRVLSSRPFPGGLVTKADTIDAIDKSSRLDAAADALTDAATAIKESEASSNATS